MEDTRSLQKPGQTLADVAQLVGALPHKLQGGRFDSWSGHMPRLWVWSRVLGAVKDNRSMFLSHEDVSLPLFLPLFPSLEYQ